MPPKAIDKDREARVQAAVIDVKTGVYAIGTAAKLHNVPRGTLRSRLKGISATRGKPPILTSEEETVLRDWIVKCQKKGFPRRKLDILLSVKEFLDKDPTRQTPFANNLPGMVFCTLLLICRLY